MITYKTRLLQTKERSLRFVEVSNDSGAWNTQTIPTDPILIARQRRIGLSRKSNCNFTLPGTDVPKMTSEPGIPKEQMSDFLAVLKVEIVNLKFLQPITRSIASSAWP